MITYKTKLNQHEIQIDLILLQGEPNSAQSTELVWILDFKQILLLLLL